jgi:hypothetical protein
MKFLKSHLGLNEFCLKSHSVSEEQELTFVLFKINCSAPILALLDFIMKAFEIECDAFVLM